jgi:DNA-binding HxlR family transcriptional regulator
MQVLRYDGSMQPVRLERDGSVFHAVAAVGDAWSWMVLREAVFDDVRRFDDFRQRLGIARTTLSKRLGHLVASSVFERRGHDYVLTERGDDFLGCLLTAMRWGDRWCSVGQSVPVRPIHRRCGKPLRAQLSCGHCALPVVARDVSFNHRPQPVCRPLGPLQRQRMPGLELLERNQPCSIARTLQVIGDLWSALIIQESFFGTHRFDDFQQRLGIASNILSHRLSRLTQLGVLAKPGTSRTRDGYQLTEKGLDLYPVPLAMLTWGDRWLANPTPIKLTHQTCRHRLRTVLTCSHCGGPIDRSGLDIAPTVRADMS